MSWGSRLMGKQKDYKNCWGPFGCINKNRFLWLLIFCRNFSRIAAMLTWGLPVLGCVPPFSSASGCVCPFLILCCSFFSLSLSSFSLFCLIFILDGRMILLFVRKKAGRKWALFCGNTEVTVLLWLKSYLVLPRKVAISLRCSLHHSLLILLLLVVLCVCMNCSASKYIIHMPILALGNVYNKLSFWIKLPQLFHVFIIVSNYEDRYFEGWDRLENAAMKVTVMAEGILQDHFHRRKSRNI